MSVVKYTFYLKNSTNKIYLTEEKKYNAETIKNFEKLLSSDNMSVVIKTEKDIIITRSAAIDTIHIAINADVKDNDNTNVISKIELIDNEKDTTINKKVDEALSKISNVYNDFINLDIDNEIDDEITHDNSNINFDDIRSETPPSPLKEKTNTDVLKITEPPMFDTGPISDSIINKAFNEEFDDFNENDEYNAEELLNSLDSVTNELDSYSLTTKDIKNNKIKKLDKE